MAKEWMEVSITIDDDGDVITWEVFCGTFIIISHSIYLPRDNIFSRWLNLNLLSWYLCHKCFSFFSRSPTFSHGIQSYFMEVPLNL